MLAAAFPLAQVAIQAAEDRAAEAEGRGAGSGSTPGVGDLPFAPREGSTSEPGSSEAPFGADGSSSRPDAARASQSRAGASGSVLLDQVIGAGQLMGYDLAVPALPTAKIASEQPLRAAILAWIAATGSIVPADELTVQLARADAMPVELQRDIALLILSTIEATTLQRAALAKLSPAELEWVYTHPEVAEQMAQKLDTPATRYMAILAAKVDMEQSLAASLLLLAAVEATKTTFDEHAARESLGLLARADLDPTTRAMIDLLLSGGGQQSDADKVRLAAKLVALGAGIAVPAPAAAPTFPAALEALLTASGRSADAKELDAVLSRAKLLPLDLQGAVAGLVLAEAKAIDAANPLYHTPTSQSEALVAMLVAVADALPTLQKYNLYWGIAPEMLRLSEWDPALRAGWTAHHAALAVTTQGSLVDLARASAVMAGHDLPEVPALPSRSFLEAYEAVAVEAGFDVDDAMRQQVADAAARLDPAVRDAATLLLTGAAESARLHALAYADLSAEERDFLRAELEGMDALYTGSLSHEEIQRLARARDLAARVDVEALHASRLVAVLATQEAQRLLEGADAFGVQGTATPVKPGFWDALKRLLPIGSARAQEEPSLCGNGEFIDDCGEDVLLRIRYPPINGAPPGEAGFGSLPSFSFDPTTGGSSFSSGSFPMSCDDRECAIAGGMGLSNREILVIYGSEGTVRTPEMTTRFVCGYTWQTIGGSTFRAFDGPCRPESVPRYGAPTITLDLGGNDRYMMPLAMTHGNSSLPVSLHLDVGGNDQYADPSPLYDRLTPLLNMIGVQNGHPTQASAMFGGVAVLVDASGNDVYTAATRSQAYGRTGFGLLADLGGTDAYGGRQLVQAAATETMTLGGAVLFDQQGNDRYTSITGQGFGLGALLLDGGGADKYVSEAAPLGVPVAHLDVLPGGEVTTFDARGDNRFWLDGPGTINVGLGVDTELLIASGQGDSDSDGFADFVELAVGTDTHDRRSTPLTEPTARVTILTQDSDGDGWPDYIERVFSTDPDAGSGGESYPAGLPSGLRLVVPSAVHDNTGGLTEGLLVDEDGTFSPTETGGADETAPGFRGSDKILDLRLPLQDAGSIDFACTGTFYLNQTAPMGISPGSNLFRSLSPTIQESESNAPKRNQDGSTNELCLHVSYDTHSPGEGNGTIPSPAATPAKPSSPNAFTFQLPAGIIAIGDVVGTQYAADYFVVIDLGGPDNMTNSAGGGLVAMTTPKPTATPQAGSTASNNTFIAPSLVVNVDVAPPGLRVIDATMDDLYVNATRDFAQGSYFGVLVDTGGSDTYTAANVSQGSLGGILLDLGGASDTYTAGHLSQGAGLAGAPADPTRTRQDLPENGAYPADKANAATLPTAQRRMIPGFLVDYGDGASRNTFTAGSYSQGFAQGFLGKSDVENANPTNPNNPPNASRVHGVLASLGSADTYTARGGSRFMQGVGGADGIGLLLDQGGKDNYFASGAVSQGATMSQLIATGDPRLDGRPHPAGGILIDVGDANADDTYLYSAPGIVTKSRTAERNQNTTLQRGESATSTTTPPETRYHLNVGLHVDTVLDGSDPELFLAGLGGTDDAVDVDDESMAFHVHLPTARLAIGKEAATRYEREYAFVVDLGGSNTYAYSAAGHIRDYLAQRGADTGQATNLANTQYGTPLNLFPVTLLVDAGIERSEYALEGGLGQGAGFFGVGILADLGGHDSFRAIGKPVPGLHSTWMNRTAATIDGAIGSEWDEVAAQPITLVGARDATFASDWQIRVANDDRALYLALTGTTTSVGTERYGDQLAIALDPGRRLLTWDTAQARAGIDQVVFTFIDGECQAADRAYRITAPIGFRGNEVENHDGTEEVRRFEAACRFTQDGQVTFELRKDLIGIDPVDPMDMDYCYEEGRGLGIRETPGGPCVPDLDLGIFLQFLDAGAGMYGATGTPPAPAAFVWPAGATMREGDVGYAANANMSDEMERWGVIGLAFEPTSAPAVPDVRRAPSLAQGVGVGGVGVLAMLGTSGSADLVAGDRSQAFAALGGLGLVLDAGGSDRYVGGRQTLAAADVGGIAVFLEAGGNDNYFSRGPALAHTPASGAASAFFFDMGGDDEYAYHPNAQTMVDALRGANSETASGQAVTPLPDWNNVAWTQSNTSAAADYQAVDAARQAAASLYVTALYESTHTIFDVVEYDPEADAEVVSKYGTHGCTDRRVPMDPTSGKLVASGKVCFLAAVETGRGPAQTPLAPVKDATGVQVGTLDNKVNVKSVDFIVDRIRLVTTTTSKSITPNLSVWSAVVDLGGFTDGVVRAKALPLFEADITGYGVYLFADSVSNAIADTPATKSLFINNAPAIAVGVEGAPGYTGRADAAYSPYAYGDAQRLTTGFAISPDAGEFRYTAANDFRAPRWNTSIPCSGAPGPSEEPPLCSILPFYLPRGNGDKLRTEPGTYPNPPPPSQIVREPLSGDLAPYTRSTDTLREPLTIYRDGAFHLSIPDRTSLLPLMPLTTFVRVSLVREVGSATETVKDRDNDVYYLANVSYTVDGSTSTPQPPDDVLNDLYQTAIGNVDTVTEMANGPFIWEALNTTYDTGIGQPTTADVFDGSWNSGTLGAVRLCQATGPTQPAPYAIAYTAFMAVDSILYSATTGAPDPALEGFRLCSDKRPMLDSIGERTSEIGSLGLGSVRDTTDPVAEDAEDAVYSGTNLSDEARENDFDFNDFFFDLEPDALPRADFADGFHVDGEKIVIPAGYQIALEFGYRPSGTLVDSPGGALRSILLGQVNETEADAWGILDTPVGNLNEPIDGLNLTELALNSNTGRSYINSSTAQVDRTLSGGGLPAGYFYAESGAPDQQARLEIKVPAEPTTRVDVRLEDPLRPEDDRTVAVLTEGRLTEGDLPGQPARLGVRPLYPDETAAEGRAPLYAWATTPGRRWTEHEIQFAEAGHQDGLYLMNVSARDDSGREHFETQRVLLDGTAPLTRITTDTFAGSAYTARGLPIRWSVDEHGSGVDRTYVLYRIGEDGDIADPATWTPLFEGAGLFGPGTDATVKSRLLPLHGATTVLLMAFSSDRARNVEGTANAEDLDTALLAAFEAKLASYRKVTVDLTKPAVGIPAVIGGREVNFEGSDYVFVRAGEPVSFALCVADEHGILPGGVNLLLDSYSGADETLRTGKLSARADGSCANGGARYVAAGWQEVNTNATLWPSGVWQAQFEVIDRAGNMQSVFVGAFVLDQESPRVLLEPPVLPVGQSAVKPGDQVKIRFAADDAFGVDEGAISVDAAAFARNAAALPTRAVRVNGVIYQEATFTVDRTDLKNGVYEVVVRVPDLAGSVTEARVHIAVDFKRFEFVPGTLRATNATHNSVVLRWETTENTSAFAKFGTSPTLLSSRTTQDLNTTKEHALLVTGLSPSTRYFMRAVSVSAGGFVNESAPIEIETTTALYLSPISPQTGDDVSGLVDVRFKGGLLDSADFVSFTLEVRDAPGKAWTFVTTATRQGDEHVLRWNSTRFLDATGYELRLTTEAGRDLASVVIGSLTSDNTPPSVLVLTPLLATNDTTPALRAEAADALSGFGATPAQLLVDGVPIEDALVIDAGSDGRLRISHEALHDLAPGVRLFELRVTDRAGNVARESWRVAIDGDAPDVFVNPTRFSPGTAAAKLGGTVTLNLTILDLSGVSLVAATTDGVSSQAETRLVKLVNTDTWQGTFDVTSAQAAGEIFVPVRAVDLAGNTRELVVRVPIDNVVPTVSSTSLVETRHTTVVIDVPANEVILVNGTATAARSPAVTAATSAAATTARITFDGLLPSRTYAYRLTAVDLAGNAVSLQGSFATMEDVTPPGDVGLLSVVDLLNGTLHLTWQEALDDVGISHYRVYRSEDGVSFEAVAETVAAAYDDAGLAYEKTYVYQVAAVDHGGNEGPAGERLTVTVTAVPIITLGEVSPTVGSASTTFRYSLTYAHPGGRAPAYVRVILDGVPQNMTLASGDAETGAQYVYETRLAPHKRDAPHTYAYEVSDGRYTVRYPADGSSIRGPLVSGDALSDGPIEGFAAFAQRVPLGGAALMLAGLAVALGIASAIGRRNKKGGSK